ncbi:MAG: hypothetical protein IT236_09110 [Bacteroidia bacterium]|nr:hypothetical protein [Bacteroidia bacterium]
MKKIFLLAFLLSTLISCKKNQLGGKSTVNGTVLHHSRFIAGARVFIKFNANEFPGNDTTKYDAKVVADLSGNYNFKCYQGNYFLYAYGYDDQLRLPVFGGTSVKVRTNEIVSTDLAVFE